MKGLAGVNAIAGCVSLTHAYNRAPMAITFISLTKDHLTLMHKWFNTPHVQQWWNWQSPSLRQVEEKYVPYVDGTKAVSGFIVQFSGKPIGYVQVYPVKEFRPYGMLDANNELLKKHDINEMAGVDIFIGEAAYLDKGYGAEILRAFLGQMVFSKYRFAVIDPQISNLRAIRAYEKAGFLRTEASQSPDYVLLIAERFDDFSAS